MAAPTTKAFDWTLRDGTRLHLRPIRPDDKDTLQAAIPHISAENLYRRFFMPVVRLSEQQLRFLTEIDHVHHIAWLALAVDAPERPLAGVARCVQLDEDPTTAESALLVVDRFQRRGIGTLLLAVLTVVAARQGIAVLRSFALEENLPFLDTMRRLGARSHWEYANVRRVDLPVHVHAGDVPQTPGTAPFATAAPATRHRS
jgi:GNAT superfamily N-acetyltransferase